MAFLRRRKFLTWIGMALTSLLLVIGSQFINLSPAVSDTTLVVYAAVSLTDAVNQIEANYQSANPDAGITFVNNYDSSGILLNKIEGGDAVDIFISAATDQIDQLDNEGKLLPGSRQNVVTNQLVLVTPTTDPSAASDAINTFNDLTDPSVASIAIGDPNIVPAGKYATQLFQNRGVSDAIGPKLVLATNVRNVLNAVVNKTLNGQTVDAGVVYITDANTTSGVQVKETAGDAETDPIIYPAAVLSTTTVPDEAQAFANYLTSIDAQNIFRGFGFGVPF